MKEQKKCVPEIRFAGFTDDWEQRKLGDIVERVTRKNYLLESSLPLTISAQDGLIAQNEFFDKQVASKNIRGYYLIRKGEFAYNKSYSNGYPWGAIKRLDNYLDGVLSTLYIVFKPININSQYLVSYFNANYWHKEIASIAVEGARNHGLLNIPVNDFFNISISLPKSKEEQTAIGNFFKQLDDTIALHQRTLEKYQKLKISYLEKMFPKENERFPELRFPNFTDAWEQRKLGEVLKIKSGMSQKNIEDPTGVYPILATGGEIGRTNTFIYNRESVLIGRKGTINRPYYMNTPFWTVDTLFYSELSENISGLFIYNLFQTIDWMSYDTSTGVPSLTSSAIHNINVYLPKSKEEQTAIGNFFKQLDDTIALHQREVEKYKKIKQAYLEKMFI